MRTHLALAGAFAAVALGCGGGSSAPIDAPEMAANSGQAAFVQSGPEHVLLGDLGRTAGGITLGDWVRAWADGSAGWGSVGP